jgi:hypothetical protein
MSAEAAALMVFASGSVYGTIRAAVISVHVLP